jgi:hypothetical protein
MTSTEVQASDLQWYLVKLTHPNHNAKVVFRSVSQNRAENFLMKRFPRGSEAYLVHPDGTTYHYEAERQGDLGKDSDAWAEFDPSSWIAPAEQAPPGENAWSDKEG